MASATVMKVFALVLFGAILATYGQPLSNAVGAKKFEIKLSDIADENSLDEFLAALKKFVDQGDVSDVFNTEFNPLVDDLLSNVSSNITRSGMDPLALDDETLELLGIVGSIKLTSGWLQGIATLSRNDDVTATYNSATKKITFSLPLQFNTLLFTYKYVTRVTLLKISGDVQGKIDDVHMNLQITFDRDTKGFVLDHLDMKDSGKITVKFTGNDLVDWITNAMTSVITTVLHPLIVAILKSNVKAIAQEIVDVVNDYLLSRI